MKKSTWNTLIGVGVFAILGILVFSLFGGQPQQAVQTQPGATSLAGYTPFQLYEVNLELRNEYDKTAVPSDGDFLGKVYEADVSEKDMKDPRTPYVELLTPASDFATTGILTATKTKILTNNDYKVLLTDNNGLYYATVYEMKVPALESGIDSYTFGPAYVEKIGNLAGVTEVVENSSGVSVSIDADGNAVATVSLASAPDTVYFTVKMSFENTVADSVVKDVVIRAVNDPQNPLDSDAIDSVKFALDKGDNLGIDSDVTSLIRAGQKIEVGDIEEGIRSVYEVTVRLDKALLEAGNVMYIYVDDLGDYLGEDVAGDNGMTPKYIKIEVA